MLQGSQGRDGHLAAIPQTVKGRGTLNSLEKFAEHNRFACAIKVSRNNYGYDARQKLLTVPFYFFPFLAEELAQGELQVGKE